LKQRNAALRSRQTAVIDSLDKIIAPLGERLNIHRQSYFEKLAAEFVLQSRATRSGAHTLGMQFYRGWKEPSLAESLIAGKERDLEHGLTRYGPHRADLLLTRDDRPLKSLLSRGEQKSLAASLLLSQAALLKDGGENPVILLDDLASEFDQIHFGEVLEKALSCAEQVWVTGVQPATPEGAAALFHVEHGHVFKVV
jgi:DNA replication and repair protein RecF